MSTDDTQPVSHDRAHRAALWGGMLALLTLAAVAYWYAVNDVPSGSGDEGNWMNLGYRLTRGMPIQLPVEARFVTTLFARIIGLSFGLFGVSLGAARGALGLCVLVGAACVFALCSRMRLRALGLALCAPLLLHPWTVCWSRSVVVPYPISLMLAVLGPLAWLYALHDIDLQKHKQKQTLALVLAGQILVFGLHFSPFALVPSAVCGLWLFVHSDGRRALRTPGPWLALAAMLAHAAPIAVNAFAVVGQSQRTDRLRDLSERTRNLARSLMDGLSGEQTVRDYAGDNAHASLGVLPSRVLVVLVLCACIAWLLRVHSRRALTGVLGALTRFAPMYLTLSVLLFPWVLAPARDWWLATIDSERYLFVILAPAALLLATTAVTLRAREGIALVSALTLYFALGPNLRIARYFWHGGDVDHGYFSAHSGGGYRGYKVVAGPRSLTTAVLNACHQEAAGRPMVILLDDYAFHPIRVLVRAAPTHQLRVVYLRDATLSEGERVCVPVWPSDMFAPGHVPGSVVTRNERLRAMSVGLAQSRKIAAFSQPNGRALLDVFVGHLRASLVPEHGP
ncbi:MAG: hypothetical protein Q8Q09_13310 [Deltaproteobacteria bacterium]|nr:hypothetical protein [Deltaproteobacteria bacterium]